MAFLIVAFPVTPPASRLQLGGVVVPKDQSEALWISFSARYPCALKIAAGKINAVSGEAWCRRTETIRRWCERASF